MACSKRSRTRDAPTPDEHFNKVETLMPKKRSRRPHRIQPWPVVFLLFRGSKRVSHRILAPISVNFFGDIRYSTKFFQFFLDFFWHPYILERKPFILCTKRARPFAKLLTCCRRPESDASCKKQTKDKKEHHDCRKYGHPPRCSCRGIKTKLIFCAS